MKLIFVINDGDGRYLEYCHTGVLNAPNRRSVEIELSENQIKEIGLQKIGANCGKDVMESIESVSLKLNNHE